MSDREAAAQASVELALTVNGQPWQGTVPVEEVLLDLLRGRLRLTGTKRSCESLVCGACTVLVDGEPYSACNLLAFEAQGRSITTIEGLAAGETLHPLQEAFIRQAAAQCGYCTSGQLLAASALLRANPAPTYAELASWLSGNLCRCGAYPAIARAVLALAGQGATGGTTDASGAEVRPPSG